MTKAGITMSFIIFLSAPHLFQYKSVFYVLSNGRVEFCILHFFFFLNFQLLNGIFHFREFRRFVSLYISKFKFKKIICFEILTGYRINTTCVVRNSCYIYVKHNSTRAFTIYLKAFSFRKLIVSKRANSNVTNYKTTRITKFNRKFYCRM